MVNQSNIKISLSKKAYYLLKNDLIRTNLPQNIIQYITEYHELLQSKRENQNVPYLTVQDIKKLKKAFANDPNLHLYEILKDAVIDFQKNPEPLRNLELQARIEKLKKEQEEKEYKQMVKNIDSQQSKTLLGSSFSSDVKALRSQMIAVINFVVTILGTFAFGYKAVEYALPAQSIPAQVLVGVSLSTIVALAELYFLIKQLDYQDSE